MATAPWYSWSAVLLVVPMLLSLSAAYPHGDELLKAYREELEGPVKEESVRHIDGLGGRQDPQTTQELKNLMNQMEDQMKGTNGKWNVKYSKYSSHSTGQTGDGMGAASDGVNPAPVRAIITGEALDDGQGGIVGLSTNCRNCKMTVRKVGSGGSSSMYQSSSGAGQGGYSSSSGAYQGMNAGSYGSSSGSYQSAGDSYTAHSSGSSSGNFKGSSGTYGGSSDTYGGSSGSQGQSRYYSSRTEQVSSAGNLGTIRPGSSEQSGNVQSSHGGRIVYSGPASTGYRHTGAYGQDGAVTGSNRREEKVTRYSWRLSDLGQGYETENLNDIMRRLQEDLNSGKFQNGKTVTTVTTSTSANGGPAIVEKKTYVKDGFDTSVVPEASSLHIGKAEIEELMRQMQEDITRGKQHSSRTVTTVVTSSSTNGQAPVVTKKTYSSNGALENFGEHSYIGSNIDRGNDESASNSVKTAHSRKVYMTSGYGSESGSSGLGGSTYGHRSVDSIGGGNLLRNVHERNVTVTSVSEPTRWTDQETRSVDSIGGGNLIRNVHVGETRVSGQREQTSHSSYGTTGTSGVIYRGQGSDQRYAPENNATSVSVTQMKGYRQGPVPDEEVESVGYGAASKYYSTFERGTAVEQSGVPARDRVVQGGYGTSGSSTRQESSYGSSGATHHTTQDRVVSGGAPGVPLQAPDEGYGPSSTYRQASSSSHKYSSYGQGSNRVNEQRDLDHIGGGHLIRGVPLSSPHISGAAGSSVVHAQTDNSHGTIQKKIGPETSSYQVTIEGSSGGNDQDFQVSQPVGGYGQSQTETEHIPEASVGSYFSSSSAYRKSSSSASGLNSDVLPGHSVHNTERRVDRLGDGNLLKRGEQSQGQGQSLYGGSTGGSSSSFSRRVEWSGSSSGIGTGDAREADDLLQTPIRANSPSIRLGYGSGNGAYGSGSRQLGRDYGSSSQTGDAGSSLNRRYESSSSFSSSSSYGSPSTFEAGRETSSSLIRPVPASSSYGTTQGQSSHGSYGSTQQVESSRGERSSEGFARNGGKGMAMQSQRIITQHGPDCDYQDHVH